MIILFRFHMESLRHLRHGDCPIPWSRFLIDIHREDHIRVAVQAGQSQLLCPLLPRCAPERINRQNLCTGLSIAFQAIKAGGVDAACTERFIRLRHRHRSLPCLRQFQIPAFSEAVIGFRLQRRCSLGRKAIPAYDPLRAVIFSVSRQLCCLRNFQCAIAVDICGIQRPVLQLCRNPQCAAVHCCQFLFSG